MMAGGVESWSPSPSPPEGRGEGKMVVVGGAMVMDFFVVLELGELEYPIFVFQCGTLTWHLEFKVSHFSLSLTRTQSQSHSHLHLKVQTPHPHTIGGRKPVGARRLSSVATS